MVWGLDAIGSIGVKWLQWVYKCRYDPASQSSPVRIKIKRTSIGVSSSRYPGNRLCQFPAPTRSPGRFHWFGQPGQLDCCGISRYLTWVHFFPTWRRKNEKCFQNLSWWFYSRFSWYGVLKVSYQRGIDQFPFRGPHSWDYAPAYRKLVGNRVNRWLFC